MIHTSPIIESQVAKNFGKKGYWKQSLVCSLAYRLKISMSEAWKTLNFYVQDFILCSKSNHAFNWTAESHNSVMKLITNK